MGRVDQTIGADDAARERLLPDRDDLRRARRGLAHGRTLASWSSLDGGGGGLQVQSIAELAFAIDLARAEALLHPDAVIPLTPRRSGPLRRQAEQSWPHRPQPGCPDEPHRLPACVTTGKDVSRDAVHFVSWPMLVMVYLVHS